MNANTYSIDDLSKLTGLSVRTIRFYIQMELVSRPEGAKRASHYLDRHLEELLHVKRLAAEGRSLESIRMLMKKGAAPEENDAVPPGTVRVCSHIHVARGVELVVDPRASGLSLDAVRLLTEGVLKTLSEIAPEAKQTE
jgi:DNA-binding transcriptional MerR regulator